MSGDEGELRHSELPSPWTPRVLSLLRDWNRRAAASSDTHYAIAARLGRYNVLLGIPVVVLTAFVGTSVFATLQHNIDTRLRILVGSVSVIAGVLASLQTFLRFAERGERHRAAAERWAAVRREISEMLALHPTYLAARGDPKEYLDALRRRMDEVSGQSPEMGARVWAKAVKEYELSHDSLDDATYAEPATGAS